MVVAALMGWSEAHAEPVTVWLTDQAPQERFLLRADRQTGGTLHLWSLDVRYPPTPETPADDSSFRAVLSAVAAGKERWEEFEVEPLIADEVRSAVSAVTLLNSERNRGDLVRALLFEGAAVARGFDPRVLEERAGLKALRFEHDGRVIPRAWLDAYALAGRAADRSDMVDGTAWYHYEDIGKWLGRLPKASLEIPDGIGEVFLNGAPVESGIQEVPPGRHYVHTVRAGVVHGRQVVDLAPGEARAFPASVSEEDLGAARERVLAGKRVGMPESLQAAVLALSKHHDGEAFLAALDGNRMEIVGFAAGAAVKDSRLVTVMLDGGVGGAAMIAMGGDAGVPIFSELNDSAVVDNPGQTGAVPAAMASFGLEVGISHFLVAAGVDLMTSPGRTITWADGESNQHASVFANPWGGLGAYIVRPTKKTATLAILGTAGWMSPSHALYGGKLIIGVPIDDAGNDFRVSLGGSYGPDTVWQEPLVQARQPLATAWLRIGFGARL